MEFSIKDIIQYLNSRGIQIHFSGDEDVIIRGYSSLDHYKPDTITWVKNSEKINSRSLNEVALVIVPESLSTDARNCISCKDPKSCFFLIVEELLDVQARHCMIGKSSLISPDVMLGENVSIGENCILSGPIKIGGGTRIGNGVVISNRVTIGRNCQIQSLSVIGEDGFGYYEGADGIRHMIRHHGGVVIGDNVFIGSHVNIARGTIDDTVIGNNVKIAPSTHIGHNNQIDDNAVVICSRVYGSCHIGNNAYLSSCTIKNQMDVGIDALVGMGAVVTSDIDKNKVVVGIPAKPIRNRF